LQIVKSNFRIFRKEMKAKSPSELVGSRLRALRGQRGWTQEELVQHLGQLGFPSWRQSKVAKIERGEAKRLPLDDVLELAAALGVAPVYLFSPGSRDEDVQLGPRIVRSAVSFRQWLRGRTPLSRSRMRVEEPEWPERQEYERFYYFVSPPPDEWRVERHNLEAERRMREMFELITAEAPEELAPADEPGRGVTDARQVSP